MPTRDILASFWRDYNRLTPEEQARFRAAVRQFIEDLSSSKTCKKAVHFGLVFA